MDQSTPADSSLTELIRHLLKENDSVRSELALALHDDVLSGLATLKLRMECKAAFCPASESPWFSEVIKALTDITLRAREVAHRTWPPELDTLGLRESLSILAENAKRQGGLSVNLEWDIPNFPMSRVTERVVYRTVQEGLTNVIKHAFATEVSIRVCADQTSLCVSIQDNGRGVCPGTDKRSHLSLGLIGMRQRWASIGGSMSITSRVTSGTLLRAWAPFGDGP